MIEKITDNAILILVAILALASVAHLLLGTTIGFFVVAGAAILIATPSAFTLVRTQIEFAMQHADGIIVEMEQRREQAKQARF